MLPSLTLTLIATAVALLAAILVAVFGRRVLGPRWAYVVTAFGGLLVGWIVLVVRGGGMTLIGLGLLLTLALTALGALTERFRLPRPVQLAGVLLCLAALYAYEYRRGDMYALQCGIWAIVGLVAFYGATFHVRPAERPAPFGLSERAAPALSPAVTLVRVTPLAAVYFALIGHRLPNPGLMTYALLALVASGVAYLASLRGGRPAGTVTTFAVTGLLFSLGWYAWLGYASPEMAMAPFVLVCADAAWTLGRRAVTGRLLGGEPSLARRLLGILDARDDSVYQRTAAADGVRAADADLLLGTLIALVVALAEWYLKVAAVPGIVPFAALALAYVATAGWRAWRASRASRNWRSSRLPAGERG